MKIYVIRHGFTNMNKEHRVNGRIDEDINEEGIRQAKKAINDIEKLDIDLIFCSPMIRARHTCEIINTKNLPVIYDERLVERTLGNLDGKILEEEGFSEKNFYNYFYESDIKGFESLKDLEKRVKSFLLELKEKHSYNSILIVTHSGVSRAIYFYFNSLPEDGNLEIFRPKNCEINEYEI